MNRFRKAMLRKIRFVRSPARIIRARRRGRPVRFRRWR